MTTTRWSDRVEALLDDLTLDEQAALTAGSGPWHTTAVERLGIGRLKVTDGPTGARGDLRSGAHAACFPVGVALGATWDPLLLEELGAALAVETIDKGARLLLGPTINLQRTPLGGRSFECYSEDPWLTAVAARSWIRGLQDGGVGACIKHFVANDSEFERHTISSEVDERTLREVLLRPFQLAMADVDPWTVMAAYNRINSTYACEHPFLLTQVLRDEWGWPGAVISDWGAVRSTAATAIAGNDLEMPGPAKWLGPTLAGAARAGDVEPGVLRTNAGRMLHLLERAGILDDPTEPEELSIDRPEHRALARRAAAAAMVLLRNEAPAGEEAPLLPLDAARVRTIAVIGPNADPLIHQGGGSSEVLTHPVAPLLASLAGRLGDGATIVHEAGARTHRFLPEPRPDAWVPGDDGRGVVLDTFASTDLSGRPAQSRRVRTIGARWFGHGIDGVDPSAFSCRYSATHVPTASGAHTVGVTATGRVRVLVDGAIVADAWSEPTPGDWLFGYGFAEMRGEIELTAGEPVDVVVEYASIGDGRINGLRVGLVPPDGYDLAARAVEVAATADVVLLVVGTSGEWETEGNDRAELSLPGNQDDLIRRVAAANPRTAVVVNAGSAVAMPWEPDVASILSVWFPGYEGGRAVADVLFGDAEPAGRLPHTVPVAMEDVPALCDPPASYPGTGGQVHYAEGIGFGYRGMGSDGPTPRFAFGHGLGYATYTYGDAVVSAATDSAGWTVTVPVTNTADRDGSEVVQVYVEVPDAAVARPHRQLVGFTRRGIPAGETIDVSVDIDPRALEIWDPATSAWRIEPVPHRLHVGRSSGDVRSTVTLDPTET